MITFILLLSAVGIMAYWVGGEAMDIITGDLDTFLGKILGYFLIIAFLGMIIGWQILRICYNIYIVN